MDFYTTVLRKSGSYWVGLCLENGIVGQGHTKEAAVAKLREAIDSIEEAKNGDEGIYSAPLSIKELHEFLMIEGIESADRRIGFLSFFRKLRTQNKSLPRETSLFCFTGAVNPL